MHTTDKIYKKPSDETIKAIDELVSANNQLFENVEKLFADLND